jgi:hypothetical protein
LSKLSYRPTRRTAEAPLNGSVGRPSDLAGGGSNEMRETQRFRPEPVHRGPVKERHRVRRGTPRGGGPDRSAGGRDPEQTVPPQKRVPCVRGSRKPALEGRPDLRKLGWAAGDRHYRRPSGPSDRVEVEHVESPHDGAVEEHGPDRLPAAERREQPHDPFGSVPPIDADAREPDRLDALRGGDDHRGDRRLPVSPFERPVVDADDARVRLAERPPQR